MRQFVLTGITLIGGLLLTGCGATKIDNSAGRATVYEDARSRAKSKG